jgi:ketosteroid isomerase-like protein
MFHFRQYTAALRGAMIAAIAIPAVAGAQGIQPHQPLSTTPDDIARVRTAYVNAVISRNPAAVTAMYTADAVVLGPDGSETVGGRAIAKMHADSAAAWRPSDVRSTKLQVFGATAVDVGTWTIHTAAGDSVRRYLMVLRHGVNGWKMQSVAVTAATR